MAIDYFASLPCKVRETLSDTELLAMLKARNRANVVLNVARNDPKFDKSKPESEWRFNMMVMGPNGPEKTEMRIADCLAQAAPLEQLAPYCKGCPGNVRSDDFGCGGAIHYPITAQAERWLVSRLPADLKSVRGHYLMNAISDFNYDGAYVDASRGRTELYQSSSSVERQWGTFLSKKTRITSSQVIHMAFGVGSLQSTHARLLAYIMAYLNDDFSISDDPANAPQPGDDDITCQLKYFFSAAALAGAYQASVFVDA